MEAQLDLEPYDMQAQFEDWNEMVTLLWHLLFDLVHIASSTTITNVTAARGSTFVSSSTRQLLHLSQLLPNATSDSLRSAS